MSLVKIFYNIKIYILQQLLTRYKFLTLILKSIFVDILQIYNERCQRFLEI